MAKSSFKVQFPQAEFFQIDSPCREQWLQQVELYYLLKKFSIFHVAVVWGTSTLVDHASDLVVQKSHTEKSTCVVHVNCLDETGKTPLEHTAASRHANVLTALLCRGGKNTRRSRRLRLGMKRMGKK